MMPCHVYVTSHYFFIKYSITYHLRNRFRRFLDSDTCNHVLKSLVISKLDYGNALLLFANIIDIQRLQRLQNWSAKLIFGAAKRDHATAFLDQLHWLPVQDRIIYKTMLYVFKCINRLALAYLSSGLSLYSNSRSALRSSTDTTRTYSLIFIWIQKFRIGIVKNKQTIPGTNLSETPCIVIHLRWSHHYSLCDVPCQFLLQDPPLFNLLSPRKLGLTKVKHFTLRLRLLALYV